MMSDLREVCGVVTGDVGADTVSFGVVDVVSRELVEDKVGDSRMVEWIGG